MHRPLCVGNLIGGFSKKEKERKKEKPKGRKGGKEGSFVDSVGVASLVVKWTRFCGREPTTRVSLILLSFLHLVFPRGSSFSAIASSFFSNPPLPPHRISILLVFPASLFRPLVSFPAFRNGRTLLR